MIGNGGRTESKVAWMREWMGFAFVASCCAIAGVAQATAGAKSSVPEAVISATRTQVESVRDEFVQATSAAGQRCSIAKPKIVVADVASLGSYDPETNTLTTPAWEQLTDKERGVFYHALGPETPEAAARLEFETAAHHWILIHEMGHWWQACRGARKGNGHYAIELGADRIAAAYWQERDMQLIAHQRAVFVNIVNNFPSPVPAGQNSETYFNANYDKLGPTPAYFWFQAQMCIQALEEQPAPTFSETLR
ncbi:MAG TPA: hypothetical protein VK716_14270 [Terracidiphilus sp.]|jgi:hypothetical protein|nr:hypothetical protein [Terracidiphilus sp.]